MGYILDHKWYICLHLPTSRIYISRDITFYETHFPFAASPTQLSLGVGSNSKLVKIQIFDSNSEYF